MSSIVIGAGANGLTAAFYLAKAGHRPIVLERANAAGGGAITAEIHPGFHAPIFSHEVLLHNAIVRDMNLGVHGLRWLDPDVEACAPALDGLPLVLYHDAGRSADAMRAMGMTDADAWLRYRDTMNRLARAIAPLLADAAPVLRPGLAELWQLFNTRRRIRRLGRDAHHLLRWLPMPVADFVSEWFADDRLRALIAATPLSGTMLGPRSAGSTLILLLRQAHLLLAGGRDRVASGGPGACMRAMADAARAAGAEIRTSTSVEQILVERRRVTGVVTEGRALQADLVISTIDPKTTLLKLVDRDALPGEIAQRMANYRASGTMAKINLALSALPTFGGADEQRMLTGRIQLGASHVDDLERAFDAVKYGEMSAQPWLDMRIPSILDAGLAPAGSHVASIYVHNVPYTFRAAQNPSPRDELLRRVLATIERHAPGATRLVVAAQVMTPADLESRLGMTGGHIFHGELAPDQLLSCRPVLGLSHTTPIQGLYLGSAGTHPGGFLTGAGGRLAARAVLRRQAS